MTRTGNSGRPGTPMTLHALYRQGLDLLVDAGVSNARNEAVWLLQSALGCSRHALFSNGEDKIGQDQWAKAWAFLARRANGEPLQYILGTQEFCGLEFRIPSGVLIPRPETELIVQEVFTHRFSHHPLHMIDIGTGSGCLAVTLAVHSPRATIWGTDCCPQAIAAASANAVTHAVQRRVLCKLGSYFEPLHGLGLEGQVSVMVSNPPYIPTRALPSLPVDVREYEPWLALDGGHDGLDFFRPLLQRSLTFLHPEGILVLEVGKGQASQVCREAESIGGYRVHRVLRDASQIERTICLERKA